MKSVLILVAMVGGLFGFAGGGGSSSDYGGGGSSSYSGGSSWSSSDYSSRSSKSGKASSLETFICWVIIGVVVFLMIKNKLDEKGRGGHRRGPSMSSTERGQMLAALSNTDYNDTEREKWIHKEAELIFKNYQQDWSNYDLENIRKYTTDKYFEHVSLMLEAIDKAGRRNVISDLKVHKVSLLTEVKDDATLPMKVVAMIKFSGVDGVVSTADKKTVHSDKALGVVEFWNFIYDGQTLKLDSVGQSTESMSHLVQEMEDFAKAHQMFYSPDWGRLALPTNGLIFNEDALSRADVNNHVVGRWNNCLVQMYTYSATPAEPNSYYLVGQINVPKSYEGVIVEAVRAKLRVAKPENYDLFEMEWGEFNKWYHVYASSRDALTAFELLNPAFMEKLYARSLPYNLEVKGNTIYIFAKVGETRREDYAELFNVLSEAFSELKM